jgi:hypothetical protein
MRKKEARIRSLAFDLVECGKATGQLLLVLLTSGESDEATDKASSLRK